MNSETEIVVNENIACEECGNFGALPIGEKFLCADCISNSGSSCAGSPDDDGC